MTLDQTTVTAAGDLLKQVGFPVATAAYFMWRDYVFIKDVVKYETENHQNLVSVLAALEKLKPKEK